MTRDTVPGRSSIVSRVIGTVHAVSESEGSRLAGRLGMGDRGSHHGAIEIAFHQRTAIPRVYGLTPLLKMMGRREIGTREAVLLNMVPASRGMGA